MADAGDAQKLLIGEAIACRSVLAALAREILLHHGSEAFVRAEAQAKQFAEDATARNPLLHGDVARHALLAVEEIFGLADGAFQEGSGES